LSRRQPHHTQGKHLGTVKIDQVGARLSPSTTDGIYLGSSGCTIRWDRLDYIGVSISPYCSSRFRPPHDIWLSSGLPSRPL
jgi:hypothetical protein